MINSDEHYRSIIEDKDSLIDELYGDIEDLKTQLELANDDIDAKQELINYLNDIIKNLSDDIDDKQELINYLNGIIKNLSGEIERLEEEVQLYQRDCMGKN